MEPPPPSYEEVVEGKNELVPVSSFQREKEKLELAKKKAVEDEDYERARQLKEEIENLTKRSGQLTILEERKRLAVADENYSLAQQIKKEIDALKAGGGSQSEVICYELGQGSGYLLHLKLPQGVPRASRPTPVIVLDRSLSMKGSCRWAITVAVPTALSELGYQDTDRCILLTFDSVVERVNVGFQDPMLRDLWKIDVSARGKTTMLAQVFQELRQIIRPNAAYNVFVISDGFVHDIQHVRPAVRDITNQGITNGSRVSFALFRFFNGTPPDTAALAAVASVGNDGSSPCVDCIPPMEWLCTRGHLTSFRKTVCDTCDAVLSNNVGNSGREPLTQFCHTAKEAFTLSLHPHCRVSSSVNSRLMRVPFIVTPSPTPSPPNVISPEAGIDLPCGKEVILALSELISDIMVGENKMMVTVKHGLPSEQKLAEFCSEALSQLRLWAVGGVRKKHFSEAIEWFRRLARLRASAGLAEGNHVTVRAWGIRRRLEEGESALGRICSLGDADTFVSKLNSKQQGDFLRGASVGRSERALTRRAFGSDIFFHDAARTALAAMPSVDGDEKNDTTTEDTKEEGYVSYYGGGTYGDQMTAAGVLSKFTEDLNATDILEVVGGLGAPFCGPETISPGSVDAIWEWEMRAVDSSAYLSEADVWAARANGEPLRLAGQAISGVIPLSICGSSAHASYTKMLEPLALMHIGSQLHGNPAKEVWSWDPTRPPYNLPEALAAREAAALRCLLTNCVGTSKVPSASESTLIFALLAQFRERAALLQDTVIQQIPFSWARNEPTPSHATSLLAFAITFWTSLADNNQLEPKWARRLYCIEVNEMALRNGIATLYPTPQQAVTRNDSLVNLLAADPEKQRLPITETQIVSAVQRRIEGLDTSEVFLDGDAVRLADASVIAQRLPTLVAFPLPLLVFGLYRVLVARKAGTLMNPASDCLRLLPSHNSDIIWYGVNPQQHSYDLFPALVIASSLSTTYKPKPETIESAADVMKELQKLLTVGLQNDYQQRLNVAVIARLQAKRAAIERSLESKSSSGNLQMDLSQLEAICAAVKGPRVTPGDPSRPHISFVFCGHVDSGKSTLAGRLLLESGRLGVREVRKLHAEAVALNKGSFVLAYSMDKMKAERERGISIVLKKTWLATSRHLATILDTPGHSNYVGNMLRGVAQGDVGVLVVPADDHFTWAVSKGNAQLGERQGSVRTHAHFLSTAGIKQLIVLINKMDSAVADWGESRFRFVVEEVKNCLRAAGWKNEHLIPMIPISAFYGDNVVFPSTRMTWWKGQEVPFANGTSGTVVTVMDALNDFAAPPPREMKKPLRIPISGVFKISGVGDVLTGRVEQGSVKNQTKIKVLGHAKTANTHVHCIETHHNQLQEASAGHIIGLNVKNLSKAHMPQVGDMIVLEEEKQLAVVQKFTAQVLVEHHGQVHVGYSPLCVVRTAKCCSKISEILWKRTSTGERVEKPPFLTRGDFAEVVFDAMGPLVLDTFTNCEALSRVIFLEGGECVMIGKVVHTTPLPEPTTVIRVAAPVPAARSVPRRR